MHQLTNPDLAPQASDPALDNPGMQRAFTQAQLIIYRECQKNYPPNTHPETYNLLQRLADEIHTLAQAWQDHNNFHREVF